MAHVAAEFQPSKHRRDRHAEQSDSSGADPLGLNRNTVTVQVTWDETASGEVTATSKTVRLDTVVAPE